MSTTSEFHLRIPSNLYARIKDSAKESGISTNAWIVSALDATVDSSKFLMKVTNKEDGIEYEVTIHASWAKKLDWR